MKKILILLLFLFLISGCFQETGTNPKEILNHTKGNFQFSDLSFVPFYNFMYTEYETGNLSELGKPRLGWAGQYYCEGEDCLNFCKKPLIINFSNEDKNLLEFNYLDKKISYKVNLFEDIYYYSSDLKGKSCFFNGNLSSSNYIASYFKDDYNNQFIEAISKDFEKLKSEGYSLNELVEIATLFVQSIPYGNDEGELNKYPYETIYEIEGNCLDKSVILSGILKKLNYTSYIIFGDSEEVKHALVGIVCNKGNLEHNGEQICFIETTLFSPIGSESDIKIEGFLPTNYGKNIYSEQNYGSKLANIVDNNYQQINDLDDKLEIIDKTLNELQSKMCQTDCVFCYTLDGVTYFEDPTSNFCDDADIYNIYVLKFNNNLRDYNSVYEELWNIYYNTNLMMFGNIFNIDEETIGQRKINEEFPLWTYWEQSRLAKEIHRLINVERSKYKLSEIGYNTKMNSMCREHSLEMANNDNLFMEDLDGEDFISKAKAEKFVCESKYQPLVENVFKTKVYHSISSEGYDWLNLNELAVVIVEGLFQDKESEQKIIKSTHNSEGIGVAVSKDREVYVTQLIC